MNDGKMSEIASERNCIMNGVQIVNSGNNGKLEEGREESKEEDDLLGKHIKKMNVLDSQANTHNRGENSEGNADIMMEESVEIGKQSQEDKLKQNTRMLDRKIISYKAKLIGEEEKAFDKNFEEQMEEWLKEESEIVPSLTEEQKKLLESMPNLNIPNERFKELCRPWKDSLILTLLGKKINIHMMKDRVKWL